MNIIVRPQFLNRNYAEAVAQRCFVKKVFVQLY